MKNASFIYVLTTCFFSIPVSRASDLNNHIIKTVPEAEEHERITFSESGPFKMAVGEQHFITWSTTVLGVKHIMVSVEDEFVSVITDRKETFAPKAPSFSEHIFINSSKWNVTDITISGYFNMSGKFVGYNNVHVKLYGSDDQLIAQGTLKIFVLLRELFITQIYFLGLTTLYAILFIHMGASLDLELIKNIIKQPSGPAIGLFSQYVCMPIIAFGLGLILFPEEPLYRLGLFASGCSPGGGSSNMWTHLLGGSLDLSTMMTFTSTVVSLVAVPLWILTLGTTIMDANFVIPYTSVLTGMVMFVIPSFIGIFIQLKLPRLTTILKLTMTPIAIFNITYTYAFGVYANWYMFSLITWQTMIAGFFQSMCGSAAGLVIAVLFRRNLKEVIAIGIETGFQNNIIAIILLKLSLESPAGDIAILIPSCAGLGMSVPLLVTWISKVTYENGRKYMKARGEVYEEVATGIDIVDKHAMQSV